MKQAIFTLTELTNKGVKVARLAGNRDLNEKAVKAKMKSMREYGQLVPAIIVDASTAIKDGLKVVDFTTGEEIKDGNNYVVLLDANHRFKAHSRLLEENKKVEPEKQYKGEFYFVYSLNPSVGIEKALAEINIATTPWKGADYVKGVKMNELTKLFAFLEKYSINFSEYMLAKMLAWAQTKQNAEVVHEYFLMRACCRGFTIQLLQGLKDAKLINESYEMPKPGSAFDPCSVPLDRDFIQDILNH